MNTVPHIKNFIDEHAPFMEKFVICIHGFSTNKHGSKITRLMNELQKRNIGAVAIDLPAHGENKKELTIENCIADIKATENYLRQFNKPISFYGSSFGAYTTLSYMMGDKNSYDKIFLLVPAIVAYEHFKSIQNKVHNNIFISPEFIKSIRRFDVMANAQNFEKMDILYAEHDITVSNDNILAFAKLNNSNLYEIKGADHYFDKDGELDQVIDVALKVYCH
ncbi:MAG: alpha/beta hydrolase [Firmicutes bacterium]|nr:alpha/beta hydrolase [Bacillota bacterium]